MQYKYQTIIQLHTKGINQMDFVFSKNTNIECGEEFYIIIGVDSYLTDGIEKAEVSEIDWNHSEVVFEIAQSCQYVSCSFYDMSKYVFKTKNEAEQAYENLPFGVGLLPA